MAAWQTANSVHSFTVAGLDLERYQHGFLINAWYIFL